MYQLGNQIDPLWSKARDESRKGLFGLAVHCDAVGIWTRPWMELLLDQLWELELQLNICCILNGVSLSNHAWGALTGSLAQKEGLYTTTVTAIPINQGHGSVTGMPVAV